jgi:hypothetical protein
MRALGLFIMAFLPWAAVAQSSGQKTSMTRESQIEAEIIRVLLREGQEGRAAFEYDRPRTSLDQVGDKDVDEIAGELDGRLRDALVAASA